LAKTRRFEQRLVVDREWRPLPRTTSQPGCESKASTGLQNALHFGQNDLWVAHELEGVYAHRPIDAGLPKAQLRSVCGNKSRALRLAKPPRTVGATL
jgi:hypothetical protein